MTYALWPTLCEVLVRAQNAQAQQRLGYAQRAHHFAANAVARWPCSAIDDGCGNPIAVQRGQHMRQLLVFQPARPCPHRQPCNKVAATRSRYGPKRSTASGQGAQRGRPLVQVSDCKLQPRWWILSHVLVGRRARGSAIVIQEPAGAICNGTPPAVANFCKLCKSWSTLHVVHDDDGLFWMEAHHLLCVVVVGCGHDVDRSVLLVPVADKSPRTPLRAQAGARVALEPWVGAFATPPLHGQRKWIPVHVRRCLVGMREVTRRSSGAVSLESSTKVRASRPATAGGGEAVAIAHQD